MRRKIFERALPEALALADGVFLGAVNRAQLLSEEDRLSPEAIAQSVRDRGASARACASAEEIAELVAAGAKPGDVVLIMSNGGFDGLTAKLFEQLNTRAGVRA
jgi:UDP-N-acetylmuramate: L-alanyl-gamma-D-glutamyl-meso-diaminopimelate ligase